MKQAKKRGINFGLTSGVITTLGLIVGLNYITHSKLAVLGGILTIAIADALSDAMGMHISEESLNKTKESVWTSTKYTFFTKFFLALTFAIPVLLFSLSTAVIISIIWGFTVLTIVSNNIAKKFKKRPLPIILEHLIITIIVIIITYFLGIIISSYFA